MTTKRRPIALPAALLLALLSVSFAVPGCAWSTSVASKIEKNLPIINADVGQVVLAVNTVETWLNAWFANHPSPTAQTEVSATIERIDIAADGVTDIVRSLGDLQNAQGQAALDELLAAYKAFASLARSFGVGVAHQGTGRVAIGPKTVAIPPAEDFRLFKNRKPAA